MVKREKPWEQHPRGSRLKQWHKAWKLRTISKWNPPPIIIILYVLLRCYTKHPSPFSDGSKHTCAFNKVQQQWLCFLSLSLISSALIVKARTFQQLSCKAYACQQDCFSCVANYACDHEKGCRHFLCDSHPCPSGTQAMHTYLCYHAPCFTQNWRKLLHKLAPWGCNTNSKVAGNSTVKIYTFYIYTE